MNFGGISSFPSFTGFGFNRSMAKIPQMGPGAMEFFPTRIAMMEKSHINYADTVNDSPFLDPKDKAKLSLLA